MNKGMTGTRARIIVTTSHRPSQRARSFVKELASVLPYAIKLNRGKATIQDLYYEAYSYGAERVIIVGLKKGNPGVLRVYKPGEPPDETLQLIATISLSGVRLRRETPGSQRIFQTRRLALDASRVYSEEASQVIDTLAYSMLAKILVNPDEDTLLNYDVVAIAEEQKNLLELSFLCTRTKRVCGPTLRIQAVTDLRSNIHIYLGSKEVVPYKPRG